MTLSLCSVGKLETRPQKTQILSPQPYCSSPPSDNAHKLDVYIVQQQISLFLEAQGCTLSFNDRGGCSSWVQRVTWREEREIISSPVPSPLTRESRPPCVNMGSKSPRPQEEGSNTTTTTSSPTQHHPPLSTLATHVLGSETLVWASCGLQMQTISIIYHIFFFFFFH